MSKKGEEQYDFLPEDQQEGFEDEAVEFKTNNNTVLYSTDWTVDSVVRLVQKGRLNLNPSFQRRQAWNPTDRSRFIESLILNIPVPQIVLAEHPKEKGKYIVIDGKQRLLTVTQFLSGKYQIKSKIHNPDSIFEGFKLSGLKNQQSFNGKYFCELDEGIQNIIEDNVLRTVIIRSVEQEEFLFEAFLRLNQGSKSLSTQELRQAMYPGHYTTWLDKYVCQCKPLQKAFKIDQPDARMRDTEIALRFFAFDALLDGYDGNFKKLLDRYTEKQAKACNEEIDIDQLPNEAIRFERALETTIGVFGEDAFKKYDGEESKYISRFNRAVFDSMTYFFRHEEIAEKALESKDKVVKAFKNLCTKSEDYLEGVGPHFRSVDNTYFRLHLWGEELGKALDINLSDKSVSIKTTNGGKKKLSV